MFHPWRALRALSHVVVVWFRPHAAAPAATNGADLVWLDPRMTQAERRCALTHELVHLEHGHRGCQPPSTPCARPRPGSLSHSNSSPTPCPGP